ncbi:unnamed protein product [Chilo suppressalis]|uniref:Serendipity locus protein alpha n=1 Tax=Chilo suppressalis TaxID=168631 RepID=A0ABN8AZV0_CHISP|nr:unnamed protein product [Chilo suppressalis]
MSYSLDYHDFPKDIPGATKYIVDYLLHTVCPMLQHIATKFRTAADEDLASTRDIYLLSSSQITKCVSNSLEIFKTESKHGIFLTESRIFIIDRLNWCMSKLNTVAMHLNKHLPNHSNTDMNEDLFMTPMYFVNWIDYTFDILSKLSSTIYRTDYKDDTKLHKEWKNLMVDHITNLHMCIDELLLSAMTLCKYCLDEDQPALKARCHVVLRETKALFSELVTVDITKSVKITPDKLKLPVMPSNVNILIDVLKDVLYVLETNTNTALLSLLIHCYAHCNSPVDLLKDHFSLRNGHFCPCATDIESGDIETCEYVKSFDLHNERLLQIGFFAVSCSSDQKRIVLLRSGLSSLESLDPHLVPAISTASDSVHTTLLISFWKQEVMDIRNNVFLIVDPVAFVERCKLNMKELLLEFEKQDFNANRDIWAIVINVGSLVFTFFSIYKQYEPNALVQNNELDKLLQNLDRVQRECKVVFDILTKEVPCDNEDKSCDRQAVGVVLQKLSIRARLLYSLVKKIHELFVPKDDDQFFELCEEADNVNKNLTHTILKPNTEHSQRKSQANVTRSIFARTTSVKVPMPNEFLSKLTKHLKVKRRVQNELNFSAQVSALFEEEAKECKPISKDAISLRRELFCQSRVHPFNKNLNKTFDIGKVENTYDIGKAEVKKCKDSFLNETTSLQISAILNQLNDITDNISTTASQEKQNITVNKNQCRENTQSFSKRVLDNTASTSIISNVTQPSNVTTLERISDLDLVESKLYSLKIQTQYETSL